MVPIVDQVHLERDGAVATITINRPQVKNAVLAHMWGELRDAFREVGYDSTIRAVVLTGGGDDFCSGADVGGMGRDNAADDHVPDHPYIALNKVADACSALFNLPKPTVAKVRGVAAGAGANLALCCDLVVAADDARFSEIFARRGLSLDFGGSWILPRLVGLQKAKELAFFTEMIPADEAKEIGLVNKVVPAAELDNAVDEWTTKLVAGPPIALALSKSMLNRASEISLETALVDEARSQAVNLRSSDVREAGMAWIEKRDAEFTGW